MKVLLVNKFFYRRGGSEAVFFDTADLLKAGGDDVGLLTLVDGVKALPVACKITGDGPMRGELELACAARGVDNVSLLGYQDRDELAREVSDSMFLVVPSEWYENSPRSISGAFAWGKPVVASRIGGIAELVVEGRTGFAFSPGNVADLRERVLRLLQRPESIAELGRRARKYVEQHLSHDTYLRGPRRIYEQAIEKHETA